MPCSPNIGAWLPRASEPPGTARRQERSARRCQFRRFRRSPEPDLGDSALPNVRYPPAPFRIIAPRVITPGPAVSHRTQYLAARGHADLLEYQGWQDAEAPRHEGHPKVR